MRFWIAWCAVALITVDSFAQPAAEQNLRPRIESIRKQLPEFKKSLEALKGGGADISYPNVSYTVLDNFTQYALDDLQSSVPNGWGFMPVNGVKASYQAVHEAHSGDWAAKIVNASPLKPQVYGMMENSNGVKLQEGKPYTISAWAKGSDGVVSMTLNANWSNQLEIKPTGGEWKRFSKTFTPARGDTGFGPRVITQDLTSGIILDDICLVEGEQPEAGKNLMPNGSFEESWNAQRVARELGDMEAMSKRLDQQLAGATSGKIKLPSVPRWDGKQRPKIDGPSFVGSDGRSIFFVGYGHFKQAREDIEKFPSYGINIIQCGEFGPSAVFPKENETSDEAVDRLVNELDRASKAGVAVDFLISPHYVPDWLFAKYPHLRKPRADFFPYSIYAPEGKELVEKFVAYVVPKIKDKPALLSICLSNEPINVQQPDEFSQKLWHQWLAKRYGEIGKLNEKFKTKYASVDEVPQPNPMGKSDEPRPGVAWSEFLRWNAEAFADFHKEFADAVKKIAPNIPVHIKATTWHYYRAEDIQSGDDATLFGKITDINGNDSVNLWGFNERAGDLIERGTVDFAQGWRENAIGYELERSAHDAPVFNSENHPIFDRETRYVDPLHIRSMLWMGAIHGQNATTTWVWEREKNNPRSDFAGSIMERASCAEATGIVCLDLNRAAKEVTAIQKAPYDVLILQSHTAAGWDGPKYDAELVKLFTAASFTGLKVGFITERQLEDGKVPAGKILFVPNVIHICDAAMETLKKWHGPTAFVGEKCLTKNEYDEDRVHRISGKRVPISKTWQETFDVIVPALKDAKIAPAVELSNDKTPMAVQWQTASLDGATIVNLYNASHDEQTVKLSRTATDVLRGAEIDAGAPIKLIPMETRLLRCK